jgi:hypothetical protein
VIASPAQGLRSNSTYPLLMISAIAPVKFS